MQGDLQLGFGVSAPHSGVTPSIEREMPFKEKVLMGPRRADRKTLLILADKNQFLKLEMADHIRNEF